MTRAEPKTALGRYWVRRDRRRRLRMWLSGLCSAAVIAGVGLNAYVEKQVVDCLETPAGYRDLRVVSIEHHSPFYISCHLRSRTKGDFVAKVPWQQVPGTKVD